MARRLLAFALAFVVIGAPLAGQICGAFCGEHAASSIEPAAPVAHHHSSGDAVRPSHHHQLPDVQSVPSGGAEVRPAAHVCARLDAVVAEARQLSWGGAGVAAAAGVGRLNTTLVVAVLASDPGGRHSPPISLRSTSPLRI
jgi:hypothetical protein